MIQILPLSHSELAAVAQIEQSVQAYPWVQMAFEDSLKSGAQGLVAKSQQVLIGFCLYLIAHDEAEILSLATASNYQKQGVATQLLMQLENALKARGIKKLFLEVRVSNTAALACYEKNGFVAIHRRKAYYRAQAGREDALVYVKQL